MRDRPPSPPWHVERTPDLHSKLAVTPAIFGGVFVEVGGRHRPS
jgi:hypothetical protein